MGSGSSNKDKEDIYAMGSGLLGIQFLAGLAQMVFAMIAYFVNKYFINEGLVEYAAYAMFGFGFFIAGVRNQTVISPSKKIVKITRGFFFIVFNWEYGSSQIDSIQIIKKTRTGTDPNGIGPTKENTLITTYYAQLVLKTTKTINIYSGSERNSVSEFAQNAANVLGVTFEPQA